MHVERLQLKLYVASTSFPSALQTTGIFQGWIRDKRLGEEMLIDVADYAHVHHGPGIMLIGHQADYALDESEGRTGLLYSRKRDFGGEFPEQLGEALRRLKTAAEALQAEAALPAPLTFANDELLVRVNDRLHWRNDDASAERLIPEIRRGIATWWQVSEDSVEVKREGEPRQLLTLRAHRLPAKSCVSG